MAQGVQLVELGDSAESKFDSIRFTIVASLGVRIVNFPEIQYFLEFSWKY